VQFHLLSFEGPDAYSRAGGLATRVVGLAQTLADLDFETHLWFIGDPDLPAHETHGPLHYHRWCQWVSKYHPHGVYDGELGKAADYNASLPPYLLREVLLPRIQEDGQAIILAEEWQTVDAVLHLHWLLRYAGLRERVSLLWNANNTFGFERIPWSRLAEAAVDALVVPNGLTSDAFDAPGPLPVRELRRRFRNRTLLTKVARWDPGKRWIATIDLMAEMKRRSWRPLLVARGGSEPYGNEVLAAAHAKGLKIFDRAACRPGPEALLEALDQLDCADVVNLISFVDPESRRLLFRAVDAVLANSGHEPFGLVGLETMAAGGLACTGCSGEDYAVPGRNALVLETEDPHEFMALFRGLRTHPARAQQLRRAGRSTARHYAWPEIVEGVLLPRCELPDTESYESGLPPLQRVRGTAATALRKVG
jgi:glycosyltransferase involved in cell wall biosynthesis